jgi:hypothetical protein
VGGDEPDAVLLYSETVSGHAVGLGGGL